MVALAVTLLRTFLPQVLNRALGAKVLENLLRTLAAPMIAAPAAAPAFAAPAATPALTAAATAAGPAIPLAPLAIVPTVVGVILAKAHKAKKANDHRPAAKEVATSQETIAAAAMTASPIVALAIIFMIALLFALRRMQKSATTPPPELQPNRIVAEAKVTFEPNAVSAGDDEEPDGLLLPPILNRIGVHPAIAAAEKREENNEPYPPDHPSHLVGKEWKPRPW
jgi:hypothetical protein